ncbi:MAG: glycosyl transferase [Chloroflexota bacterium]|nr:MAG: glycosyl transferase [Chloroflexota bacterium]
MKITYLSWTVPYPPDSGGKNRSYNLSRYLAERHEVHLHLVSWSNQLVIPQILRTLFASITVHRLTHSRMDRLQRQVELVPTIVGTYYTSQSLVEFQQIYENRPTDLILIDEAHLASYAWPFTDVPCILSRQKVDHLYYRDVFLRTPLGIEKLKNLHEWLSFRFYENRLWRRFKYGIVVSEEERNLYQSLCPVLNLAVIPNGVDISFFQATPLPDSQDPIILFHGSMGYYPNVDAAIWFVEKIFPKVLESLPRAKLFIVGTDPTPEVKQLAKPNQVIVTGKVPDMRDYLQQSQVVVVPIRVGHGTRLKIPEAMAAGRPVVSTPTGAEGLMASSGEQLLIAEDAAEFAAAVVKVLADRSLAEQLAVNGRRFVENNYAWSSIGEKLNQYCHFVLKRQLQH